MYRGISINPDKIETVVAVFKELIVSALNDKRNESCPKKPEINHNVHQETSKGLPVWICQLSGLSLTFHISFITLYGLNKLATGIKYQPTDHPGVYSIPPVVNP